jgi:hypothetical protein
VQIPRLGARAAGLPAAQRTDAERHVRGKMRARQGATCLAAQLVGPPVWSRGWLVLTSQPTQTPPIQAEFSVNSRLSGHTRRALVKSQALFSFNAYDSNGRCNGCRTLLKFLLVSVNSNCCCTSLLLLLLLCHSQTLNCLSAIHCQISVPHGQAGVIAKLLPVSSEKLSLSGTSIITNLALRTKQSPPFLPAKAEVGPQDIHQLFLCCNKLLSPWEPYGSSSHPLHECPAIYLSKSYAFLDFALLSSFTPSKIRLPALLDIPSM